MKVIAVDFDGTLCRNKWPDIGEANELAIEQLLERQKNGDKLILWTCREGETLKAALMWCLARGLRFDAVNDNLPENQEHFGNNSRKVWANEYWDDKNVQVGMYDDLSVITGPFQFAVMMDKRGKGPLERLKRWWKKWRCG